MVNTAAGNGRITIGKVISSLKLIYNVKGQGNWKMLKKTIIAAGVGFLDPTEGAARQAALDTAGNLYSNLFGNYFSNSGTIDMSVTSTDNPASGILASAGSNFESVCGPIGTNALRMADAPSTTVCFTLPAYKKCVTYSSDGPRELEELTQRIFSEADQLANASTTGN